MLVGLVYDIRENLFTDNRELLTELFDAEQANQILCALKNVGYEVEVIDGAANFARDIRTLSSRLSLVFNEAKGLYGPDRKMVVPALCRIYAVPYLGSDAYAVTLARNKFHTTAVAKAIGLRVPLTHLYHSVSDFRLKRWRHFPAFVKPNYESSSIGVSDCSLVHGLNDLRLQVEKIIQAYAQPALVQSFIGGTEVQVCLVGNGNDLRVLGIQELCATDTRGARRPFLRNDDWEECRVDFPDWQNDAIGRQAAEWAKVMFNALALSDYGRIDFRLSDNGKLYFIEASTHPHLTEGSSFLAAAESKLLNIDGLIGLLVDTAMLRLGRKKS